MEKHVYLYICDTMADWEIGYLTAELNSGRYFRTGTAPHRIVTVGADLSPVKTMGGLKLTPDISVEECSAGGDHSAALILPGGDTWFEPVHEPILKKAEEFLNRGLIVGGICGATAGLAGAGLLDSKPHTSNYPDFLKLCPDYHGDAHYCYEPAVDSEGLITASGLAPLEFTMLILRALDVFKPEVLDAWYQLYLTKSENSFYRLMTSLA
jgi:putative intracellular protease/amidase